ncbi:MAG TPA: hypothetical protein VMW65_14950 [Chloroflexota bacterium]|nr:hypothetical protein [Chloroflexota bacterium]
MIVDIFQFTVGQVFLRQMLDGVGDLEGWLLLVALGRAIDGIHYAPRLAAL